jgi:hypothetical protein
MNGAGPASRDAPRSAGRSRGPLPALLTDATARASPKHYFWDEVTSSYLETSPAVSTRYPYRALHRISTSTAIICWANSRITCRSRSGLAEATTISLKTERQESAMSPTATSFLSGRSVTSVSVTDAPTSVEHLHMTHRTLVQSTRRCRCHSYFHGRESPDQTALVSGARSFSLAVIMRRAEAFSPM